MDAVTFEKVSYSYGGSAQRVVDNVSFSVAEGEFLALVGKNGSGKSTLAKLINGLIVPTEGKVTVTGLDTNDKNSLFEIRKNAGMVFQNPDNQTVASIVEDDVAFGPENIGLEREEIGKRIEFALSAVGMSEWRDCMAANLSGGQKQRVAIAGVLAIKPKIMILDESTAMLDPRGRKEVIDVVKKLNKEEGMTVILITHFMDEALLADRVAVMHRGCIVMRGTPREIFEREAELESYSLTLPAAGYIASRLRDGGMPVGRPLDIAELAENIGALLKKVTRCES